MIMGNIVYTIGHSNHKALEFLQLLKYHHYLMTPRNPNWLIQQQD